MTSEANESATQIDTDDLSLYVCPHCRGTLRAIGRWLECSGCGRRYNIRDDIPDFLLSDPAKDVHPVLRSYGSCAEVVTGIGRFISKSALPVTLKKGRRAKVQLQEHNLERR